MSQEDKTGFAEFWSQICHAYLRSCVALLWRIPLGFLVAVVVVLVGQCNFGSGPTADASCADVSDPWGLLSRLVAFLPNVLIFLPVLWGAILLNEWLNFKKDKPSGFTHDKGCEGPPGYVRRLKEVQSDSWALDGCAWPMQPVGEGRYRCEGDYSQGALLKQIRGKFVRHENKPVTDTEHATLWRIRQNSGTEVHVHLKRVAAEPGEWHLQVQFFEWAGRRQPPVLAKDVVLEFKPLRP